MKTAARFAAVAAIALVPASASAATIYATSADIVEDGPRGSADGRDQIENAFNAPDGNFFELGYDAVVDFQFGLPTGQFFQGPGSLIEITFNNNPDWVEAVRIEVGIKGNEDSFVAADPNPFINTQTFDDPTFTFDGVFDTVRLTDLTLDLGSDASTNPYTGGFDVDSIGVASVPAPVPLPAPALMLMGGLGALGAMRLRKRKA